MTVNKSIDFYGNDEEEIASLNFEVSFRKIKEGLEANPNETDNQSEAFNSLTLFLNTLKKHPLLSLATTIDYLKLAQKGNIKARDKMVCGNLRLVIKLAKRYQGHGLELLDLIQEGVLGLMVAIRKFDVNRGTRFSTYACYWIEQSLSRALMNQSRTIRLPVHVAQGVKKVYRAFSNPDNISHVEVAKQLKLSADKVNDLLEIGRDTISYDQESREEGEAWINNMPNEDLDISEEVDQGQLNKQLIESLQVLDDKHRMVIIKRFGLEGGEKKTLAEVGIELNLSKERIRQIIAESLIKIRKLFNEENGISLKI